MEINVAILDNDPDFLRLLNEILKGHFEIKATTDTNEFMQLIRQPAVLVIDWFLNFGITGLEVMRKVREANPLCHVIFISSIASVDVLTSIINEGWGCNFILKDKSDFFTELVKRIHQAKTILTQLIVSANTEAKKDELLKEHINKTLQALEVSSNGRSD